MSNNILAAVALTQKQVELREFDRPEIQADTGILKVEKTGVCGSDWPYFLNYPATWVLNTLSIAKNNHGSLHRDPSINGRIKSPRQEKSKKSKEYLCRCSLDGRLFDKYGL